MKTVGRTSFCSELHELLVPTRTALLVVDVQNDFCHPDGWMAAQGRDVEPVHQMLPCLIGLLSAARAAGVFVVFILQTTLRDNGSDPPAWLYFKTRDGRTRTDYTIDGTWGQELVDGLNPDEYEPQLKKYRPSAFHETALDLLLTSREIASVVVCGTLTQGCVLATTLDASFHNYYTIVAEDCVQTYDQHSHAVALTFLRSRYDVLPMNAIIKEGAW